MNIIDPPTVNCGSLTSPAEHTEYELRAVRKVIKSEFGGNIRLLLPGVPNE